MNPEYKLDIRIKNNNLALLMESNGINSFIELSNKTGLSYASINNVSNLKISLYTTDFKIRPVFLKLAEYFNVLPETLCPEDLHYQGLKKNRVEREIEAAEIHQMMIGGCVEPDLLLENDDFKSALQEAVTILTPREQKALKLRFFDNPAKTLREAGQVLDVTPERFRQIQERALRKLRHPSSSEKLREFIDNE